MEDNNKSLPTEEVEKEQVEAESEAAEKVEVEKAEVVEAEKTDSEPEVKEEKPAEEKEPEATVAPQANVVNNPVPLFRDDMASVTNFDEYAESVRAPFYSKFHKIKVISYILMGASLFFVIGLFLCVFLIKDENLKWICYVDMGLCLASLIASFVFSKVSVSKSEKNFRDYVYSFLHSLQDACYRHTAIENPTIDAVGKMENEKIFNAHIYSTINRIESRCVVRGKLYGHDFVSADAGIVTPPTTCTNEALNGKNVKEIFAVYGRVYEYDYKLADGGIIVVRKGKETYLPNHTLGYQEVSIPGLDPEIYVVYATDQNLAYSFFTAELVSRISELALHEDLRDYMISFNTNGTYVYTNYSDNYMVVPTSKPSGEGTYARVISDTCRILSIFELLK